MPGNAPESLQAAEVHRAAAILRAGGLVAMPTETVYGLAANAEDPHAVARIFAAKQRPADHPLIVHFADPGDLGTWATQVPKVAFMLAQRCWPGPLTMVLSRGPRLAPEVSGGRATVALRVPDHPIALALLTEFGGAVAAPSANRFGAVSPTTAGHVRDDLGDAVDMVLDGGPCRVGIESTIVDLTRPDEPTILRPGAVTPEALEALTGLKFAVGNPLGVAAPGALLSHYAPNAEVVLIDRDELSGELARYAHRKVSVVIPDRLRLGPSVIVERGVTWIRLPAGDASAPHLYASLREADRLGSDVVLAVRPDTSGLGWALIDRLQKAAGPRK